MRRRRPTRRVTVPRRLLAALLALAPAAGAAGFIAGRWSAPTLPGTATPPETAVLPGTSSVPLAAAEGVEAARSDPSPSPAVGALEAALPARDGAPATVHDDGPSAPPPRRPPPYSTRPPVGRFGIQVSAHRSLEEAEAFLTEMATGLLEAGPIHLVVRQIDGQAWYRIRLGDYPSAREARAAREGLEPALARGALIVRYP